MKSLVDIMGINKVLALVRELEGREAVIVSSFDDLSGQDEFVGAEFRRWKVSSDRKGYVKLFSGYQLAVDRIYDLQGLEAVKAIQQWDKKLKIYEFGQDSGKEVESARVIHFDSLAAFLAISEKVVAKTLKLRNVNPVEAGRFFYRYERYQE